MRRLFFSPLIVLFFLIAGCSSTPPAAKPLTPPPAANVSGQLQQVQQALHRHYLAWEGAPYRLGGNNKNGVDCSGFVHIAFKNALGVQIPRTTKLLAGTGREISVRQLSVGDLVFFKTGLGKRHVGIYMGGGQFIHASTSRGVTRSRLNSTYWIKHYWKSVRVLGV